MGTKHLELDYDRIMLGLGNGLSEGSEGQALCYYNCRYYYPHHDRWAKEGKGGSRLQTYPHAVVVGRDD